MQDRCIGCQCVRSMYQASSATTALHAPPPTCAASTTSPATNSTLSACTDSLSDWPSRVISEPSRPTLTMLTAYSVITSTPHSPKGQNRSCMSVHVLDSLLLLPCPAGGAGLDALMGSATGAEAWLGIVTAVLFLLKELEAETAEGSSSAELKRMPLVTVLAGLMTVALAGASLAVEAKEVPRVRSPVA